MMKQQKLKLLMTVLVALVSLNVFAYDVEIDGIYYNLIKKAKQAEVTSGDSKYTGEVTIPASIIYEGVTYSVTSIGNYAFRGCSGLTSVTIPSSVTSIGGSAFYGCSGLTSVKVESGNQIYDSRDNCNAIIETATNTLIVGCSKTIVPNSVTSIGGYAFSGCRGLTSVTIPSSVTIIGDGAFQNCI